MDIVVSSNFERLLFDLCDRRPEDLATLMAAVTAGDATLSEAQLRQLRNDFDSASADDEQTCRVIREVLAESGYLLDPHTATAVHAVRHAAPDATPCITLATAHPAKFPEAAERAGLKPPALPSHLADLERRQERCTVVANDLRRVQAHISGRLKTSQ